MQDDALRREIAIAIQLGARDLESIADLVCQPREVVAEAMFASAVEATRRRVAAGGFDAPRESSRSIMGDDPARTWARNHARHRDAGPSERDRAEVREMRARWDRERGRATEQHVDVAAR